MTYDESLHVFYKTWPLQTCSLLWMTDLVTAQSSVCDLFIFLVHIWQSRPRNYPVWKLDENWTAMILDARVLITCSVVWQYSFESKRQVLQAVRLFRSNFRPSWRYLWRDYSKNLSAWHVSFLSSTSDTKLDDVLEMIYMALSAFSAQHVWDHMRNKNWNVRVTKSEKCNAAVKTYKQE